MFIYQITDYAGDEGKVQWLSAGVRPSGTSTSASAIALEAGADWVDDDMAATEGVLYKLTLAPQVL